MFKFKTMSLAVKALAFAGLVLIVIFGGGVAFDLLDHSDSYLAAVYDVVMIMTGIGTSSDPKTTAGKVFNMVLALISVGILISVLGQMFQYFSTRSLRDVWNAYHDRKVKAMQGHTIVCGTSYTLHELLHQIEHRENVWVIVRTDAEAKKLEAEGYRAHIDDYTTEAAMRRAGIENAGCVIACSDNDADNAFVALTAKRMRKDVLVIVRLTRTEHREKLRDAGADEVVAPAELAAMQIREIMLDRVKASGSAGGGA